MDYQTKWTTNQQSFWRQTDKQADKTIDREMKGHMDWHTNWMTGWQTDCQTDGQMDEEVKTLTNLLSDLGTDLLSCFKFIFKVTFSLLMSAVSRKRMKCCVTMLPWQHTDFSVTWCRIVKNFAGWDPSVTTCLASKSSCQTGTNLISQKSHECTRNHMNIALRDLWKSVFAVDKFVLLC